MLLNERELEGDKKEQSLGLGVSAECAGSVWA